MENIGLSSDILAGEKKFYIQTQYLEPAKKIMANVFENGKVINSKTLLVNDSIKSQELKNLVAKVHKDISDDMEILFYISDKVRTIQHAA